MCPEAVICLSHLNVSICKEVMETLDSVLVPPGRHVQEGPEFYLLSQESGQALGQAWRGRGQHLSGVPNCSVASGEQLAVGRVQQGWAYCGPPVVTS